MAKRVVICMLMQRINLRSKSLRNSRIALLISENLRSKSALNPVTKRSIRSMVSAVCLAKSSRVARVGMIASSLANLVSI